MAGFISDCRDHCRAMVFGLSRRSRQRQAALADCLRGGVERRAAAVAFNLLLIPMTLLSAS
jgi:hypothetical protein